MSRHANQRRLGAAKFRAILSSVLAIGLAIGGITGLAAAPAAAVGIGQDNSTKVTICHATASGSNPYVMIPVDDDSIVEHNENDPKNHQFHQGGKDIIPVFDYFDEAGQSAHFAGQNLGTITGAPADWPTGQWLLDHKCSTDGVPAPALSIDKSAFATDTATPVGPLEVGDEFDYVITVTNTGVIAASKVVITDAIPSSITVLGATYPTGWDCAIADSDLSCTIDSLAAGASATIVLHVQVAAGASDSVTNTAEACADNTSPLCVDDDAIISVIRATVEIVKDSDVTDGNGVAAGESFEYTLQVRNTGTATATGVEVTDILPADIQLRVAELSAPTGWEVVSTADSSNDGFGVTVTFTPTAGELPVSSEWITLTIPVRAGPSIGVNTPSIENIGEICADNSAPLCDTDDEVIESEWIAVEARVVCTDVAPYATIHYTITTHGVDLEENPTATLTVGTEPQDVSLDENGSAVVTRDWNSSQNGADVTASIDGTVSEKIVNPSGEDCIPEADLTVTKTQLVGDGEGTGDAIDVRPGDLISYVLTVSNLGGKPAGGILTDSLPGNLTFVSVTPENADDWADITEPATEVGGSIVLQLASPLAPGDSKSVTVVAQVVDEPGTDGVANTACVSIDQGETEPGTDIVRDDNDCDTVIAHVPTIDIIKHVWESEGNQNGSDEFDTEGGDWATVAGGSLLDYTLTVTNTGEGALSGVQVVDNLPPYLKVAGAIDESVWTVVASGGDAEGYGAMLTFTLKAGALAQGESSVIKIPVSVHPEIPQDVQTNSAEVCAYSALETRLCDEDDVTVDVVVDREIDILKTAFDSESGEEISTEGTGLLPGSNFYYLLEVANVGDGGLSGTVITDEIPAGIRVDEIVTDPAGETPYWTCDVEGEDADGFGGTLTCELSEPLAPGSDAPAIRLNVTIMSGEPATDGGNGVSITNAAEVCGFAAPMMDERLLSRSVEYVEADKVCAADDAIVPVDIPTLPVEDADIDIEKSVTLGKNNPNTSDYVNKDGVPVVNAGSTLLYTLVISNAGLGAATGVEVTDTLPAELRIPEGAVLVADGWTLVGGTNHSFGESLTFVRDVEDELSDSLGTGATWTILIPVEVNPDSTKVTAGTIVNTAAACAENDFTSPNGSEEPTGCETDDATVLIESLEVPTLPLPEPQVPTLALTGSDGFNGTLAMGLLALTGGIGIVAAARRKGQRA